MKTVMMMTTAAFLVSGFAMDAEARPQRERAERRAQHDRYVEAPQHRMRALDRARMRANRLEREVKQLRRALRKAERAREREARQVQRLRKKNDRLRNQLAVWKSRRARHTRYAYGY